MKRLTLLAAATAIALSASADSAPSFPGGEAKLNDFIAKTIVYPATARDNGIEGIVTVGCTVNPDGSLSQFKIINMIDPDLESEALRVVKAMPAWTPADKGGKAVAAPVEIPVKFTLPE